MNQILQTLFEKFHSNLIHHKTRMNAKSVVHIYITIASFRNSLLWRTFLATMFFSICACLLLLYICTCFTYINMHDLLPSASSKEEANYSFTDYISYYYTMQQGKTKFVLRTLTIYSRSIFRAEHDFVVCLSLACHIFEYWTIQVLMWVNRTLKYFDTYYSWKHQSFSSPKCDVLAKNRKRHRTRRENSCCTVLSRITTMSV